MQGQNSSSSSRLDIFLFQEDRDRKVALYSSVRFFVLSCLSSSPPCLNLSCRLFLPRNVVRTPSLVLLLLEIYLLLSIAVNDGRCKTVLYAFTGQAELARCIAALLSIFPSSSRGEVGAAATNGTATGGGRGRVGIDKKRDGVRTGPDDSDDHPPELTQRSCRSVCSRAIAAVDLEWLSSVAQEYNVAVSEDIGGGDGDADGDADGDSKGGASGWGTEIIEADAVEGGEHRGKVNTW